MAMQGLGIQVTSLDPGELRFERAELVPDIRSAFLRGKLGQEIELFFKVPTKFDGNAWCGLTDLVPYHLVGGKKTSESDEFTVYIPTNYPPNLHSLTIQIGLRSGPAPPSGMMRKKTGSGPDKVAAPTAPTLDQRVKSERVVSTWVISNLPSQSSPIPRFRRFAPMPVGQISARAFITPQTGIFVQPSPPPLPSHEGWFWRVRCLPPVDQISEEAGTEDVGEYKATDFSTIYCWYAFAPYIDRVRLEGSLVHYQEASEVLDIRFRATPGKKLAKGWQWIADDVTKIEGKQGTVGTLFSDRTAIQYDFLGQNFVGLRMNLDSAAINKEIKHLLAKTFWKAADRIDIEVTVPLDGYETFLGSYYRLSPVQLEQELTTRPLRFSAYGPSVSDTVLIHMKITACVIDRQYPFHLVLPVVDPSKEPPSAHPGIIFSTPILSPTP